MPSTPAPRPRSDSAPPVGEPPTLTARHWWRALLLAVLAPSLVSVVLWRAGVPLGCPGRLVYLYSPVSALRMASLWPALLAAGMLGGGVWWLGHARPAARHGGGALLLVGLISLGLWTYFGPPLYFNQIFFTMHSPSHDGAFVTEAMPIRDLHAYLHDFPQRAQTPPAEMRGTRVISNPPGMTALAWTIRQAVDAAPGVIPWAAQPLLDTDARPDLLRSTTVGLFYFWVLLAAWLAAGPVLYVCARPYCAAPTAAVFAAGAVLAPAAVLFSPGKDPAQLLTAAVPLYLWLRGWRTGRVAPAMLAGTVTLLATMVSLVHVWLAAIVVAATLLADGRDGPELRRRLTHLVLPAAGGAVAAAVVLHVALDCNVFAIARAVARAQAQVTRGPEAMPLAWQMLGLPLFALFAGPVLWLTSWSAGPRLLRPGPDATRAERFGRWLFWGTGAVLVATVGFTNIETPRLWLSFAPLLLLGALLQLRDWRAPTRHTLGVLALLVGLQVAAAALQWSLMDMRETETRLVTQRMFN